MRRGLSGLRLAAALFLVMGGLGHAAEPGSGGAREAAARADAIIANLGHAGYFPDRELLIWLIASDYEGPFHMVNLLKFRDKAQYRDNRFPGSTGREAQKRYSEALAPTIRALGIRALAANEVKGAGIALGAEADWDMTTLVYYPSRQALLAMIESVGYKAAVEHKFAALERTLALLTFPGGPVIAPPAP